jgi:hypothetical protein
MDTHFDSCICSSCLTWANGTLVVSKQPTLPPRTTQPTGWGTEADKLANLHNQ